MEKEQIRESLKSLIADVLPETGDINFDVDIEKEYGVNSISIIQLIIAAEDEFGISFSDYELALDGYGTFGDFVEVIKVKLDKKDME